MAIDIEIKQNGLIKKELRIEDITAGKYKYGVMDESWRLDEGNVQAGTIVFYDPEHIGRGVEIDWEPGIKDSIHLRLPVPATCYDIDLCFDIVQNICGVWKTRTFYHNGEKVYEKDIKSLIEQHKKYTLSILASTSENRQADDNLILFCVMHPISFDTTTLSEFGKNGDAEGYAKLLHDKQSMDLYYAVSRVYTKPDGSNFGAYAITAGVDTIIPIQPEPPLMMMDSKTGEPIKCSQFVVNVGSLDNADIGGVISYEDFAEGIGLSSLEKYDAKHVILPGLSEEKVKELAEKYTNPLE